MTSVSEGGNSRKRRLLSSTATPRTRPRGEPTRPQAKPRSRRARAASAMESSAPSMSAAPATAINDPRAISRPPARSTSEALASGTTSPSLTAPTRSSNASTTTGQQRHAAADAASQA